MPKCDICGVEMDYNEHGEPMYVCTNRDCGIELEVAKAEAEAMDYYDQYD